MIVPLKGQTCWAMGGEGLSRIAPVCVKHLLAVTQGGDTTVTCGTSLQEPVSSTSRVCGGSAGELVSGSRAGQNSLIYVKGRQEKSAEPATCFRLAGKGSLEHQGCI